MSSIIKSVSLSKEEEEFCALHNLSLTGLLKARIQDMMYMQQHNRRIEFLQKELNKRNAYITEKGVQDEFNIFSRTYDDRLKP